MPPLQTLRAFDEAARRSSFTAAGEALNISQSAISQQVRLLEHMLGVQLFKRRPYPLVLTDAGLSFAAAIAHSLDLIEQATLDVRRLPQRSLVLAVIPSLSTRWLVSRLPRFRQAHPDLDLTVYPAFEPAEMARVGADIGVLYGNGKWRGWSSELLFQENVYPVCSPSFIAEYGLPQMETLFSFTLLRDADPRHEYWPSWLSAAGSLRRLVERGPKFDSLTDMTVAALDGQGIALVRNLLVADDVRDGRLVRLFDCAIPSRYAYHMVWSKRAEKAALEKMLAWLRVEFAATEKFEHSLADAI